MGPEMPERGTKTSTETVFSTIFGIISTPSNWFHVKHDWWPWTIPGYITMSRRKSNNKQSYGTAAQLVPKISECQKPLENFSSRFLGIKTASLSLIIFQSAKILTRSIILLCWCNWGAFWRKNPAGSLTGFSCSCTTMPQLTGHLQPRRDWPNRVSNILITHPILRIWPRRTTTCSLNWNTIEKSQFFIRREGQCCRRELLGGTNIWFFFWVPYKS